ncbi:DUF3800 domain-containing protein [Candidatus Daviesbacteria bacterium]|nr:DUF3800 domain-containing protein [Candidatus Daviesbacteria bacterium]
MLVFIIDDSGDPGFKIQKGSRQNTLVQLADMAAGAIFASYSNKDDSFLKYLKKAGKVEDIWLFK